MAILSALSADRRASKLRTGMITVYALYDKVTDQVYVGMTNNLERRIAEHKRGQSFYTRRFKDFEVIYKEVFRSYAEGRKKEKYLKGGSGKEFLKSLIV